MSDRCDRVLMHNGRLLRCKRCSPGRLTHQWNGGSSEFIEWSDRTQGAFRLSDVPDVRDLFPDGTARSVADFLGPDYASGVRREISGGFIWEIYLGGNTVRMGRELTEEEAILQMHIAARHMLIRDMKRGGR